jgi:hypothetical protein
MEFPTNTIYTCEFYGCNKPATVEWSYYDEDCDPYSTYRCDDHGYEDRDYHHKRLADES